MVDHRHSQEEVVIREVYSGESSSVLCDLRHVRVGNIDVKGEVVCKRCDLNRIEDQRVNSSKGGFEGALVVNGERDTSLQLVSGLEQVRNPFLSGFHARVDDIIQIMKHNSLI